MKHSTVWLARHPVLALLFPVLLVLGFAVPATASHLRAGDIQARADTVNLLRYSFTLRLYLDDNSPIDEPNVTICFGDNTTGTFARLTKTPVSSCIRVSESIYKFSHVFPGPGRYRISYTGNNRNGTVLNLGATPLDLSFYIATTILIDATTGPNNSAVFNSIPIDEGAVGQPFFHSPAASDVLDKDRLTFRLVTPREGGRGGTPCSNPTNIATYQRLNLYASSPAIFQMDSVTGLITWNRPAQPGEYNIAYTVSEWRNLGSGIYREVGSTTRDMQITITGAVNRPPVLRLPADTCIVANTTLVKRIQASDPDGQALTLVGEGGPFVAAPAATFTPVTTAPLVSEFRWTPGCDAVAQEPYLATITARDAPPNCQTQLTTIGVWQIRVVGPPPENLRARNVSVQDIQLGWNPYACGATADSIRIYRKENPTAFTPTACQTGVPPGLGYTYIGSVAATDTAFRDRNGGRRFKMGSTYCYRIYATWPLPGGGESLASAEACATVAGQLPQLTAATVDATDTIAGQVTVRWTPGNHGILPTIYQAYYRLSRADDAAPTVFTLLRDQIPVGVTTHVDPALDTERRQYVYRLEFILALLDGTEQVVDTVETATTARLTGRRNGDRIDLTWTYAVPWDNTARLHYIYRRIGGQFTLIDSVPATATSGAYTDRFTFGGLPIGQENPNCYRILTRGTYRVGADAPVLTTNFSQENCVKNEPCPPVLAVAAPDCAAEAQACPATYANELTWTPATDPACSTNLVSWRLYFRARAEGAFELLATLPLTQLAYTHTPLASRLGCYQITAVDDGGLESPPSNVACQDNCDVLLLPNIISPNGDDRNDRFVPICASPLRQVRFTVYNRWGVKVYESDQNPRIEWDGTATGGRRLSDGTYYYRAEVLFDQVTPVARFFKGWVEIAGSREGSTGR